MPVDSPRKDYSANVAVWDRCQDFASGSDAVKAKGHLYLPRVSNRQKPEAYNAYLNRAFFYEATARTIEGMAGSVFSNVPTVQATSQTEKATSDVTLSGVTLEGFARDIVDAVLTVGRIGAMIDLAKDGGRPRWAAYPAHNIINWSTQVVKGDTQLTRVVLRELVEAADPSDEFLTKEDFQYRVLKLVDGKLQVEIWQKAKSKNEFSISETIIPTRFQRPLEFIPFQFFGPSRLTTDIQKPPCLGLVNANLTHYQLYADRRQLLHYMGQIQVYVSGVAKKEMPSEWGSGSVWRFTEAGAKAELLQVGSDGAAPLREAVQDIEGLMAVLGGRLLEGQVKKQEAAETVRMRRSGDAVTMRTIGQTAGLGLTKLLRWHAWWQGEVATPDNPEVSVALNTDFASTRLTAQEITALMTALQGGAISRETFYHALVRGDWAEPGIDFEAEQARIEANEPMPGNEPPDDDDVDPQPAPSEE